MLFGPESPSPGQGDESAHNAQLRRPQIARTPLAMYRYFYPNGPSKNFIEVEHLQLENSLSEQNAWDSVDGGGAAIESREGAIGKFEIIRLTGLIEEKRRPGSSLFMRIQTDHGQRMIELPHNGSSSVAALRALRLADGDSDQIEVLDHIDTEGISVLTEQIADVFSGRIENLSALTAFLVERFGYCDNNTYLAWLSTVPEVTEVAASGEIGENNILRTLEELSRLTQYPEASWQAAQTLLKVPNFVPDPEIGTPEKVWCMLVDRQVFEALCGCSIDTVDTAPKLIEVARCGPGHELNTQALNLYLEYCGLTGTQRTIDSILNPFLETEIGGVSDRCLAALGAEALHAIEVIQNRNRE